MKHFLQFTITGILQYRIRLGSEDKLPEFQIRQIATTIYY